MSDPRIEFLTRPDCRTSPAVLAALNAALAQLESGASAGIVDLDGLANEDYRTGYGTPTVLVNGEDLFGLARPEPATPM